jgi:Porin PorA
MRKVWPAWLLLGLGAFFLTAAGVSKFWATDAAERIPLDSYQRTHLTGAADKLDPATGKTTNMKVRITNITQVDDDLSNGSVIVFVTSTCVNQDVGDPADCLPKKDPRMISVSKLNWASDRHTAEAIDDPKYVTNDPPVEGLTNKWPFYPEKRAYDVWDDTSKQATPATYIGKTTVQGLDCLQYHQVIDEVPIDLGNDIQGLYSLDEVYTIDAVTGKIINQQLHDVRTLADGGATALDLTAAYTPDTIDENVDYAKSSGTQLQLVTKTLPVVELIAGVICLAVGILLLLRARRANQGAHQSTTPAPSTAGV